MRTEDDTTPAAAPTRSTRRSPHLSVVPRSTDETGEREATVTVLPLAGSSPVPAQGSRAGSARRPASRPASRPARGPLPRVRAVDGVALPEWTKARQRAVLTWIDHAMDVLGLTHWKLKVDFTSYAVMTPLAEILPYPDSCHATIYLGTTFGTLDDVEAAEVLTHELLHCHLFSLAHAASRLVGVSAKSKKARATAEVALGQHVETTTDALADAFSPMLPTLTLPPRP